jgi:hypothetical protein
MPDASSVRKHQTRDVTCVSDVFRAAVEHASEALFDLCDLFASVDEDELSPALSNLGDSVVVIGHMLALAAGSLPVSVANGDGDDEGVVGDE